MAYQPVRPDPLYSGTIDTLVMILNTRNSLYSLMSNGLFKGATVDPQGCMCSEIQLLQTILNNDVSWYYYAAANGIGQQPFTRVDNTIRSIADLRAVATVGQVPPQLKVWADSANELTQVWVLLTGSTADDGVSVVRPTDYSAGTPLTWYKAG